MSNANASGAAPSILIVGASRGLGLAMAAEFAARGWQVVGTVRSAETRLHALAADRADTVEVETLDMTDDEQIRSLRDRLTGRTFDVVFGDAAPVGVEEAMPQIVDVLVAQQNMPGLRYIDRFGKATPW